MEQSCGIHRVDAFPWMVCRQSHCWQNHWCTSALHRAFPSDYFQLRFPSFCSLQKKLRGPFWQEWLLFVFSFMMLRQEVSRPSTSQWVLCTIAVSGWKNNMVLHLGNWSLVSWHILPFVPTRLYSKGSAALQSPLRCTCWPTLGTTSCKRLRFRSGVETLSPTPIKSKKTLLAGQAGSAEGWTSVHSIDLCWCGHWFFINVLCFSQIMTHVVLMGMAIGENVV